MSRILKFIPRGTESVPAMLTQGGEGILNEEAMRWIAADPYGDLHEVDWGILDAQERAIKLGREFAEALRRWLKDHGGE